ncbi:Hypothetical protein PHPALM_37162 [Phytophthora palmivora]|uniref:Uncharacterized protein n=1 Tax=Phytophthora palmivora TaxID=4796 RepID=A0A2P4WY42_9STRA|nr:Hypothetical protein PHPALM_37162 [Phytophthora palmivora]
MELNANSGVVLGEETPTTRSPSSSTSPSPVRQEQPKKRVFKKRKATHTIRKEQKAALEKEIEALQSKLKEIKFQALVQQGEVSKSYHDQAVENAVLRESIQDQHLVMAQMRALLSGHTLHHVSGVRPMETRICLAADRVERREILHALRGAKLREAKRFLQARSCGINPTTPYFQEERYETADGDYCITRFEITPLHGVKGGVRAVFDAVLQAAFNVEIIISETSGDITVREDDDMDDDCVSQMRLVSQTNRGVLLENNLVHFVEYSHGESETNGKSSYAVTATDFVDEDDLYPYKPLERLSSISHEALVKWNKRRKEYEAKMRARCRSSGEDYNLVTQGVKETFDLNLLSTFCTLRLRMDVVDVTEERLIAEIKTLLGKVKNDDLPDIKALFSKELQMDLKESDVDARVLSYFQRFTEVVLENGLEEVFSGADGEAEKCRRLISSLAPPVLKKTVKNAVRWTHKEAGKNIQELYTLVYEKAVEHERHFQQNKRMRMTAKDMPTLPKSAKDAGKTDVSSKKPANANSEKKFTQQKNERNVEKKTNKKHDKQPITRKEPPSPCPKCQEMHWLSDCDKATDAEKIVLRQKLREANKARKSRTKRLKKLMPSTSRTVTINGILDLPCCPDTGSDHTVLWVSMWIANWNNLPLMEMMRRVETLLNWKLTNSLEIPTTLPVMKKFVLLLRF